MSLQFVLGCAGSGKTWHMYHEVTREAQEHPDDRYFVIVPEQFNMQTQRDLVRYSPHGGILNIDIVSFPRLAQYIFEETGTYPGKVLTDTGKNLVIRQAAVQVKDQLLRLGGRLDRPGCISQIKSLLSEFAQYNVTEDEIEEMIALSSQRPALQEKLRDILTISRSFDNYRREKYITSEELLKVLAQQIEKSELLHGAYLYFNGFTGFTPVQMLVLEQLMQRCAGITVALTMDPASGLPAADKNHDLFYLTGKTVRALSMLASRTGTEIRESVVLPAAMRFRKGSGLARLEKRLLRYHSHAEAGEPVPEDIHLIEAADPLHEAYFTAQRIWQLTHEEGYRYSEIAVICGDLASSRDQLVRVFEEYGIPCFLDHKNSVRINPCLEMIRAALRMVEENWSYSSVFHFLRTGYTDLPEDRLDQMENYVLAFGIRGFGKWKEEWTRFSREFPEDQLPMLNALREHLLELLTPFLEIIDPGKAAAADYTQAVRKLLEELHAESHLETVSGQLNEDEADSGWLPVGTRHTMAMEYDQIWRIVQDVLDEIDSLMGHEIVSREEFTHMLETGFDEARVGVIPPGIDEVCIGDIVRTRLKHIKVIFLTGANDGCIPARDGGGGLLSQMERQYLAEQEVELAPDARQEGFIQRFYLYQTLTKPSDQLYISYSQSSSRGEGMRPSYLIYHLLKLFPGMPVENAETASVLYEGSRKLAAPQQGFVKLADRLRMDTASGTEEAETLELLKQYLHSPIYADRTRQLLRAAAETGSAGKLETEAARRLYGSPLVLSVSALEQFSSCPFMYFVSHGLKVRDRTLLQVGPSDTGTFMHEAMFRLASALSREDWKQAEPELLEANLEDAVMAAAAADSRGRNLFGDSAANQYMLTRMRRAVARSSAAMLEQIRAGQFIPAAFEQHFTHDFRTESGILLKLKGTIDRIDVYEEEETLFLRVIDYKSSAQKIDLARFLMGAQLQLPLYLAEASAILREKYHNRQIRPAAGFYTRLQDPVLKWGEGGVGTAADKETEERMFLQKLRPDGLVNRDEDVLRMMDSSLKPGGTSLVIPVTLKKDGTVRTYAGTRKAVSDREFRALAGCTHAVVEKTASEILDGKIEISPLQNSPADTACTWCSYRDICGHDPKLKAFRYRSPLKLEREDAWDTIVRIGEAYLQGKN